VAARQEGIPLRSIDACQDKTWSIVTWSKADGENPKVFPYVCRSWRHEGECRAACGACDFARIRVALSEHSHWTYIVLTYPARDWPDKTTLFRFGVVSWSRLRKRIIQKFGNIKYIQTWEVHKSMYPHVNVVISNEAMHAKALKLYDPERPDWLSLMAVPCGFGPQAYCEAIRGHERMAGYLTKLGLELTGAAVKDQTPVNAPRHFRRIRASRGLLPPRTTNPDITGQLFKIPAEQLLHRLEDKPAV
jgi:hypothetical protein